MLPLLFCTGNLAAKAINCRLHGFACHPSHSMQLVLLIRVANLYSENVTTVASFGHQNIRIDINTVGTSLSSSTYGEARLCILSSRE